MSRKREAGPLKRTDTIRFRIPDETEDKIINFLNRRLKKSHDMQDMFWNLVIEVMQHEELATKKDILKIEELLKQLVK